jgi:23S rRNA pseudouridine1911/1915/1917 synthase
MAKPSFIELPGVQPIPILYEDRAVLAIDKPAGWMLVPFNWQKTDRNLQAAIISSIAARDFWSHSRGLKFLKHVHRLDAETTGILLFGKSMGAVRSMGDLFESREVEKVYLVAVDGKPASQEWVCRAPIGPVPEDPGRMRIDAREGKEAETHFRVLATDSSGQRALLEARPHSGRTHQIRLHALEAGCRVAGDSLYGPSRPGRPMGLRAVQLQYRDPFTRRPVRIQAPTEAFLRQFGFAGAAITLK